MKLLLKILFFPFYALYKIYVWLELDDLAAPDTSFRTPPSSAEPDKKEVHFYDAQGNLTSSNGGYFYDYKGYYHKVGDSFYDSKGNLCSAEPGSVFYDGRGNYVRWGEPFYDAHGNYIDPR